AAGLPAIRPRPGLPQRAPGAGARRAGEADGDDRHRHRADRRRPPGGGDVPVRRGTGGAVVPLALLPRGPFPAIPPPRRGPGGGDLLRREGTLPAPWISKGPRRDRQATTSGIPREELRRCPELLRASVWSAEGAPASRTEAS